MQNCLIFYANTYMNMIDNPMIGQKRSMLQAKIWSSHSNSHPKSVKLDSILNQSLVLQFKEEIKNEISIINA